MEGEEESGSDNFDPWIVANRDRLGADLAVISDTGFYEGNHPAITVGLRGLVYMQIDVTGSKLDLHSGSFGGNVQNPANALASIIARLKNDDGSVAVPGFYDEVRPMTPRDREEYERLPLGRGRLRARVRAALGLGRARLLAPRAARRAADARCQRHLGRLPGRGLEDDHPGARTCQGLCRLVADMDPQRTFERVRDYVATVAPGGVDVTVTKINDGMWTQTPIDHPATRPPPRASRRSSAKSRTTCTRAARSRPARRSLTCSACPSCCSASPSQTDQRHAPNESMRLDNLEGGLRTIVRYWQSWRTRLSDTAARRFSAPGTGPRVGASAGAASAP